MKRTVFLSFLGLVLCVCSFLSAWNGEAEQKKDVMSTAMTPTSAAQTSPSAEPPTMPASAQTTKPIESFDASLTLKVKTDSGAVEMSLAAYLTGVLAAEMPAVFPQEALMAQAVASRTFVLKQSRAGKHTGADICTQSACCQGWTDPAAFDEEAQANFMDAVTRTDGLVVAYDDALIDATFFSCSNGSTEDAAAVWGGDVPYLQAVSSPNEEDAPRYADEKTISAADFAALMQAAYPEADFSGEAAQWIGAVTHTEGGGVATAVIGGVEIRGTALRSLLGLRSTDITFSVSDGQIVLRTQGFGHRVGLSQYGAKAMAEEGCGFTEILAHYYQGTEIRRLYLAEEA